MSKPQKRNGTTVSQTKWNKICCSSFAVLALVEKFSLHNFQIKYAFAEQTVNTLAATCCILSSSWYEIARNVDIAVYPACTERYWSCCQEEHMRVLGCGMNLHQIDATDAAVLENALLWDTLLHPAVHVAFCSCSYPVPLHACLVVSASSPWENDWKLKDRVA